MTGLHGPDAPSRLIPEHHDPAIGGADMLQSVDGDWPLRDLCLIVAGLPLTGLVGIRGKLAGEHDGAIGPPGGRDAFGLADVTEFEEHRVGIVNRHDPAAHHRAAEGMLLVAGFPDRSDLLQVG